MQIYLLQLSCFSSLFGFSLSLALCWIKYLHKFIDYTVIKLTIVFTYSMVWFTTRAFGLLLHSLLCCSLEHSGGCTPAAISKLGFRFLLSAASNLVIRKYMFDLIFTSKIKPIRNNINRPLKLTQETETSIHICDVRLRTGHNKTTYNNLRT